MIEILLATYNGEKYLPEQMSSLFSQSNQDWILLVHDDGSSDMTLNIIKTYQQKYPDRICLVEDGIRTGGAKNNFAHLMSLSTSDYIMFCDQDDIWLPHKIEMTFLKMQEFEILLPDTPILIHTDLKVVGKDLESIAPSMFEYQKLTKAPSFNELLVQNNVTGCTCMVNKKALVMSMPIPDVAIMHDWWLALIVVSQYGHVYFLNEPTILYRQHALNAAGAKEINHKYFLPKLLKFNDFIGNIYKVKKQADCVKKVSVLYVFFHRIRLSFLRVFKGLACT